MSDMATLAPTANLDAWLAYANLGIPIVPEHTPSPDSATGCDCRKDNCKKPGKHPRTMNGSKDVTIDEATIRRWHRMWPHANVGTSLETAGLVIVGPDSPEWNAEFPRRGLPPGPVAQSGGGEGHLHYYYQLPPGVPATRICKSGEYDILAKGNAILAPSLHASGRHYVWLVPITSLDDIPYLPDWACDELRAAGARQRPQARRGDTDGPPIALDEFEMQVWRGELPKLTPDGLVERSGSLMKIGRTLYDAGAERRLIVAELMERDAELYQKYTARPDADARYHELVDRLEESGRNLRRGGIHEPASASVTVGSDGAETCRGCADRDDTIEALSETERTLKAELELLQSGVVSFGEARVLAQLTVEAASARTRGRTVQPITRGDVARAAGVPEKTATNAFNSLRNWQADPDIAPLLPFTINKRHKDKKDHLDLVLQDVAPEDEGPRTRGDDLRALARLPRPGDRERPGGWRPRRCADHPDGAVRRDRIWVCAEDGCGRTLQNDSVIVIKGKEESTGAAVMTLSEQVLAELRAAAPVEPGQNVPHRYVVSEPGQNVPAPGQQVSFVSEDDAVQAAQKPWRVPEPMPSDDDLVDDSDIEPAELELDPAEHGDLPDDDLSFEPQTSATPVAEEPSIASDGAGPKAALPRELQVQPPVERARRDDHPPRRLTQVQVVSEVWPDEVGGPPCRQVKPSGRECRSMTYRDLGGGVTHCLGCAHRSRPLAAAAGGSG